MSSSKEVAHAAERTGPRGNITYSVTANGTTYTYQDTYVKSLTGGATTDYVDMRTIFGEDYKSMWVRLYAATDTYYYWEDAGNGTVDSTAAGATNPSRQCAVIPSGQILEEMPGGRYLSLNGTAAVLVRISIVCRINRRTT